MSEEKQNYQGIRFLAENYMTIAGALTILQILMFVAFYLVQKSSFVLLSVFGIGNILLFVMTKDILEENTKKTGLLIIKIALMLFIFSLVNHLVYVGIYIPVSKTLFMEGNKQANPASSLGMAMLFNIAVAIAFLFLMRKEEVKEFLDIFYEQSILEKLGIFINGSIVKEGDVYLCTNIDNTKKVFIPYKDRFLHMLVLGPTGSGKTSQTIIPMLNQDMQNLDAGITVLEPKGDLAEKVFAMAQHYGRKAVYFNPILEACPTFNPLFGKEEDVIENMVTTFKMLNPDSPQFWDVVA